MISVELGRTAQHYNDPSRQTREAIAESAACAGHNFRYVGERSSIRCRGGNAPCSGTLHESVSESPSRAKFLSHCKPSVRYASPSLAWGEKASTFGAA